MIAFACKNDSDSKIKTSSINDEKFSEFFEKFKSDSLFQIERVKFPWRIPTDDGKELLISRAEWLHANFEYRDEFATRETDAYTQRIVEYGDTMKLEQRGVDNGIYVDFVFAKKENKWYLSHEIDLSH